LLISLSKRDKKARISLKDGLSDEEHKAEAVATFNDLRRVELAFGVESPLLPSSAGVGLNWNLIEDNEINGRVRWKDRIWSAQAGGLWSPREADVNLTLKAPYIDDIVVLAKRDGFQSFEYRLNAAGDAYALVANVDLQSSADFQVSASLTGPERLYFPRVSLDVEGRQDNDGGFVLNGELVTGHIEHKVNYKGQGLLREFDFR